MQKSDFFITRLNWEWNNCHPIIVFEFCIIKFKAILSVWDILEFYCNFMCRLKRDQVVPVTGPRAEGQGVSRPVRSAQRRRKKKHCSMELNMSSCCSYPSHCVCWLSWQLSAQSHSIQPRMEHTCKYMYMCDVTKYYQNIFHNLFEGKNLHMLYTTLALSGCHFPAHKPNWFVMGAVFK